MASPATRTRSPSPPRELPTTVPETVADDVLIEEETFSWFDPDNWYPVKIGDVLDAQYQVLLKLGFGGCSTAWLCRDLRNHKYVTVKVYETGHRQAQNEYKVLQHLASVVSHHKNHRGTRRVRLALGSFELQGKRGPHACIVHEPLGISMAEVREMTGGKLGPILVKAMACGMLLGLDFLHSVAHVVHTDLQAGNILLSIEDKSLLDEAVEEEWSTPGPYKIRGDYTIHVSTQSDLLDEAGLPIISDFGEAHLGEPPFCEEVMPDLYRAPEIILGIAWDNKIDIWSFGLMIWTLLEGKHLFNERLPSREESAPAHLARMISLLEPPPPDLLELGGRTPRFFDHDGAFKHTDKLSKHNATLETEEEVLEGAEKVKFVAFMRRMLQWRPEDRPSASELLEDPWLRFPEPDEENK